MGFKRHIALMAAGVAFLSGAAPATAAPPEPLVITRLPDPDPDFVPPPPERTRKGEKSANSDQNSTLDDAIQDFARAIGQAGMAEQEQIDARCRAGLPADASAQQRFARAATCRYSRY